MTSKSFARCKKESAEKGGAVPQNEKKPALQRKAGFLNSFRSKGAQVSLWRVRLLPLRHVRP
ncbi:MAG: hypothetical protein CMO55_08260 [Verrucomicrobiales bacterium]|nr:hypothetical protein [Verrucomicrobiales bacterium]